MGQDNKEKQLTIFGLFGRKNKDFESSSNVYIAIKDTNMQILDGKSKEIIEKREKKKKSDFLEEKRKEEEHVKKVTCMDLPLDWNNVFNTDKRTSGVHFDSISDALINCLTTIGEVDIEYISSVTGADYKTVIETLKGSIYQNPDSWGEVFYKGWETAEEYLSGNLMRKWQSAVEANKKYNDYFKDNLKAIEKVLPPTVATKDIYITLGSPWVPADIIDDFITYIFGRQYLDPWGKTKHDEITGAWEIPDKTRYNHRISVSETYGTRRMEGLYILEKTLNMKSVAVMDEVMCLTNASGKKKVINKEETLAVVEKQKKMIKAFQDWVWKDPARKERLEMIFENRFSCVRRRLFDGSFLEFPGMSESITLYPYQKNAVARILFTPNTLLAHDVGAGKTYVMIAAGQELRRMGLSKKNMYVVPNNIVGQWEQIFKQMYPNANVLCVEPKVFKPEKREKTLERIRDEEFDGIIIAYSCFEQIPLSREYYLEEMREKKEEIEKIVYERSKATRRLRKKQEAISDALAELTVAIDDSYDGIYFDELGINRLFVDEAHNFKNVPLDTQITNVLGISSSGSSKCKDMMDKVHLIQKNNNGKGVVMATGTPITNSITDAFIMQKYLQDGELGLLEINNFDAWVGMFAEQKTEFEVDVDTNSYRLATRFSEFHNLPELTGLLSMIADFHQVDETNDIPKFEGYEDSLIPRTEEFVEYLNDISERADKVRSGRIPRTEDNMLKITTDGRKAALDLRLVDDDANFSYSSKVARCSENVADIYFKTMADRSTQLIFCDTSTPKEGFNIYDELRDRLERCGVPSDQIAYIHDAKTERERTKLFKKVREGEIRILIGSTFKLGLGVNVQDRLIALHHIDVPWRPADMTQREGRIIRQGNQNKKVEIYRYITEGSFDAYSWQLLETKQRFISDLLSGSLVERNGKEIDDIVLNYAEVKALAIGNPLVKERVEAQNELTRFQSLQKKTIENRIRMEKELLELPGKIKKLKEDIDHYQEDFDWYGTWKNGHPTITDSKLKEEESENRKQLREILNSSLKENGFKDEEQSLTYYKGFEIILPAHMDTIKPYIWLKNSGKYHVDMADTILGNLTRIDNFLDSLENRLKKYIESLQTFETREIEIKAELAKNESYSDKIEFFQQKVKELDEELGVNKK